MCGLVGIVGEASRSDLESGVTAMASTLHHRGPDDSGTWVDSTAGLALGHRRLSVLDLSPAGRQPMVSRCGRYVIVFNGEIYNHQALRALLSSDAGSTASGGPSNTSAPNWSGHSDTETLLACFACWGIERTLREVVGMFALALWDISQRKLILARDRMGEKPLYYGKSGRFFLFGSELKAIKAYPDFSPTVDRGALALLLRHNYIPTPNSIYRGISKLPAGAFLTVSIGAAGTGVVIEGPVRYWSLGSIAESGQQAVFSGGEKSIVDELERRMAQAVRSQMIADVPLGALLSGGLDSTIVTALMQASSATPVHTFTIGFEEHQYDEADHARAVAAHLGTDHTHMRLDSGQALDLVPRLPEMYDEPFADSSQLPTYLVMQLARQHVTVALSGDGGDELFGGYNRYFLAPAAWRYISRMPLSMRKALGAILAGPQQELVNRLLGPLTSRFGVALPGDKLNKLGLSMRNVHSLDDLYVSLVSEWHDPAGMVVNGDMPNNLLDNRGEWPALSDPLARMMVLDGLTYLPDDILVKVDRAAMAVSLETRAPFLDRDVVEFAWSLPTHAKIRKGKGKWPLRLLLDRYVPRELMDRPKMGFGIPLDSWLRGPLRDWAEELLNKDRILREGYLRPEPILRAWKLHQDGQASFGYRLWSVLMFQAWLEGQ